MHNYDKIIIGGGLYGLYSALYCGKKNEKILLFEYDDSFFKRATYINQARVHKGYHYPRSFSTAIKSAGYFQKFLDDYGFCINSKFEKIYATSAMFSLTNASEFEKFCKHANIMCKPVLKENIFNPGCVDGAFLCEEYTYDAHILLDYFLNEIAHYPNIEMVTSARISGITKTDDAWIISEKSKGQATAPFVLNAAYASVNQILRLFGAEYEPFQIKYELCEIILCQADQALTGKGITVMDGPFFSIMPFGKTGLHSLTAVSSTPHYTSYNIYPEFKCQELSGGFCKPEQLGNCNDCIARPHSAWPYMSTLAKKYLRPEFRFEYVKSLFSMKPILQAAEIDDSRPTVIKVFSRKPVFISVLSGKINTVYDLDAYLDGNFE